MRRLAVLLCVAWIGGSCDTPIPATARGDFWSTSFWATPLPGEHRRTADGHIDMEGFPTRRTVALSVLLPAIVADQTGFSTSSPVLFPLTVPIDPSGLPSATDAPGFDAAVAIVDVDPDSPERGRFAPVIGRFHAEGGRFGADDMLAILPVQGRPLRPGTLYAAIVTDALRQPSGAPLERARYVDAIEDGDVPPGMSAEAFAAFSTAYQALIELGLPPERLTAMTAFRTQEPTAILESALRGVRARGEAITLGPFDAPEIYDEYCAYHAVATVPEFQEGVPPYATEGGRWVLDADGVPARQREVTANLWVTVPRRAMPSDGFPGAVLIRTGSGADRPLMDRGPHDAEGAFVPGTGLGLDFARAGVLGVSIEGPHGGSRNVSRGDEQFLVFNIQNPVALRDNLRQSALELDLLVDTIAGMRIDASSCPDVTTPAGDDVASVDLRTLTLVGHSMGASIAPLAMAFEPRYRAMIVSGAGGSWIENVIHKLSPIAVRSFAERLLDYEAGTLTDADPMLALLQWGGEEADAAVYAPLITAPRVGRPRHVLMFQGIEDTYIPPPVANALTLGLSIDVGGAAMDEPWSMRAGYEPVTTLLPLTDRSVVTLPVTANVDGATAAVVQLEEDGIEDGHEVMWQRADARAVVTCFLRTLNASGAPTIVDPASPVCD